MRLQAPKCQELTKAGVSPEFARVLTRPAEVAPNLDIIIQKSDWDYPIPTGVTSVVPIYGHNADMTVRWQRNGREEFANIHHDGDDWHIVATSEQGLMAQILFEYSQMAMLTDKEQSENLPHWRRIAKMMGFLYEKEYWEWLDQPDTGCIRWNQWILDLR